MNDAWKPTRPILMTADPIGGVWAYALELCREYGKLDVSVALATMGRRLTEGQKRSVESLPNVELHESDYKLEWMANPWNSVREAGEWLLDLEARVGPALIHLNQYSHGALRWKVPCLVVGHSCVLSWFEAVKRTPAGAEWERYRHMVALGLRGADLVTAPSRFMLAELHRHYASFAAANPVYNGRNAAAFISGAKEPLVLTAGRLWDEAKNISVLQHVAGKIHWPIYAAGDNQSPDGKRIDLDALTCLGPLDENALASWYSRAPIFVVPARYEPFGLTALEAGLSGCALVLGDIPSLREIWGDAAVFVAPDDAEEIQSALFDLIKDSSLRQALAERARVRGLTFTAERMAQGYLHLYEHMLSGLTQSVSEYFGQHSER
jgi:glycosyltransferase involved in cell wall biosynthesis